MLGSIVLIGSVILTKIIGALFKIPLANILGGTGMGYFSCAYAIFLPVYAISVTGLPTAVSRIVAENMAFKRYSNVRKIRRIAVISFSIIGILSSLLIIAISSPFAKYVVSNERSLPALIAMAPCIFFGAVMAVYRGYYEGLRNMTPTALSQVIEAISKLVCGLGFAMLTMRYVENRFILGQPVFGHTYKLLSTAQEESLPYIAAGAVLGVTASSMIACLYLVIKYHMRGDGITKQMLEKDTSTDAMRTLMKKLLIIVVPIALGSVVTNLTSLIDLGTIIRILKVTINSNQQYFNENFSAVLKDDITLKMLPNFIYGSFTGLALTIFNLVPSLTSMFGKGILPGLAEAWTVKNDKKVKKCVNSVIAVTALIAIPAGMGICVLSEPILRFLYSARNAEIIVSSPSMMYLGLGVIFLSISIPLFSMLQAIGRADLPVKIMGFGVIIKLFGNLTLLRIPQINVAGAGIATTACYMIICILSLVGLKKITHVKYNIMRLFVKPAFGGGLCAISAYLSYNYFIGAFPLRVSLLFSITLGAIIYLVSLYLMNIIDKTSIKSLFFK